ncbi:unnamed protein product [Meloidogyne enterolobii]|uniref:Uncharacterized protein n=1 Tax=Meloidogyne enterolobii TaxID=390850 RepID=A0ACB0YUZ0_MELEN
MFNQWTEELAGILSKWQKTEPEERELGAGKLETTTRFFCKQPLCRAKAKMVVVFCGKKFVCGKVYLSTEDHSLHNMRNGAEIVAFLKGIEYTGAHDPVFDVDDPRRYRDILYIDSTDGLEERKQQLQEPFCCWIAEDEKEEVVGHKHGVPIKEVKTLHKCRNASCRAQALLIEWRIDGVFNKGWLKLSTANHRLHDCRTNSEVMRFTRP